MQIACCEFIALCNSCWNIYCSRTITHPARHHSVYKTLQPAYRLTATLYVTSLSVWVLCKCKCVSLYPHSTRMYVVICEQFAVLPACIYSTVTASRTSSVAAGFDDTVCLRPPLTLTFDRLTLTLKLICESHLRWGPSFQIWARWAFGFSNYSLCTRRTDRRTDGRTDKSNAYCPLRYGRGHSNA